MQIPQGGDMNNSDLNQLIDKHASLLTDRQKFVIHMTRSGWSSRRIADAIGISHTTVLGDITTALNTIRKAAA